MNDYPMPSPAIVVGIDGSRAAVTAALWAVEEAISRDVPLRLVYAIEPRMPMDPELTARELAVADAAMRNVAVAVEALERQVKIEVDIAHAHADRTLISASRSATMVCVGALGRDHATGRRLGSVAARLAQSAHCPVAIVGHYEQTPRQSKRIVAEVRDTSDSDWILECAVAEAHLRKAPLTVLATWHPRYTDMHDAGAVANNNRLTRADMQKRLTRWRQAFPEIKVEVVAACGSALNYLAQHPREIQLLVVGQDREDGLDDIVHTTVRDTKWSVLVCQRRQEL
jgi:nucleotide-binding universal stress UspA family protein